MKFTDEDIREIGLAIVGIIILAMVLFYSTTFVHKPENTTTGKASTTCTQQIAASNACTTSKNSALFVGCNGFF
jgi:hypothetical protein